MVQTLQTREAVIATAKQWLGTPFVHQAAVKGAGVGCGQFLIQVYKECGFAVPTLEEIGHFAADWHTHTRDERYLQILNRFTKPVGSPSPGDIALYRMGRTFSHSAIIAEWPRMIHAYPPKVAITDASLPLFKHRPVLFLSPFSC